MNYLCTLYTSAGDGWQDRSAYVNAIKATCAKLGMDTERFVYSWPRFKATDFYREHESWFTPDKHMGFWTWKPYLLDRALAEVNEGDTLIWLDSDLSVSEGIIDFYPHVAKHKGVFVGHGFPNARYTTADAFYLLGAEDEKYTQADHIWGAVIFLEKCPQTVAFTREWLTVCLNEEILLGQGKYRPNPTCFIDTRYTQGPLTILAVKYGFEILGNEWARYFGHRAIPLPLEKKE